MNGTLLVPVQELQKGQTLDIIKIEGIMASVKPNGYNKTYNIPIKYIKQSNEDMKYPRCQEIFTLWGIGNA